MGSPPIIALLTDFGVSDWFVGAMKGVILSQLPEATIVDFCHGIEPGQVAQAAWLLERTYRDFPAGTIYCAVVDPGVGTERRALAAAGGGFFFVAPDNGLLSGVRQAVAHWECRAITNKAWTREEVSRTFQGRDVFAPAAARVALHGGIENAGELITDDLTIPLPRAVAAPGGRVGGAIIYFDRFGNAATTVTPQDLDAAGVGRSLQIEIRHLTISRLSSTYAEVAPGEALAYWGSLGTLEFAVRAGNLRERFGLQLGDPVHIRPV